LVCRSVWKWVVNSVAAVFLVGHAWYGHDRRLNFTTLISVAVSAPVRALTLALDFFLVPALALVLAPRVVLVITYDFFPGTIATLTSSHSALIGPTAKLSSIKTGTVVADDNKGGV